MKPRVKYNSTKYSRVATELQKLRWELGISQEQVAAAIKTSATTIRYLEDKNSGCSPSLVTMYRLLDFYNISMSEFFKRVEGKA